jgi:hypothetical protein
MNGGYAVVADALSEKHLRVLRREADEFQSHDGDEALAVSGCALDAMEDLGLPPTHPVRRSLDEYCRQRYRHTGPLGRFGSRSNDDDHNHDHDDHDHEQHRAAFRDSLSTLARLASEHLGSGSSNANPSSSSSSSVYLVNEHFVVKPAHSEVAFSWHTDENEQFPCMRPPPYLSVWLALDDTSEANGTLRVIPTATDPAASDEPHISSSARTTVDTRSGAEECSDAPSKRARLDGIGGAARAPSEGESAAVVLDAKAGTAILFSSRLWHASGANRTSSTRRVFYAQFSASPITASSVRCSDQQRRGGSNGSAPTTNMTTEDDEPPLCFAVEFKSQ